MMLPEAGGAPATTVFCPACPRSRSTDSRSIVVADSRERRDGRYLERLGFYNPMAAGGEQPLRVALDRVAHWAGVGAQLSPTVARLVDQAKKAA